MITRVAVGAAASAMLAALLAAVVTSLFANYLVSRGDDRRVGDAAGVLAVELDDAGHAHMTLDELVADEHREMSHTGIAFALFDAQTRARLSGNAGVHWVDSSRCVVRGGRHACGKPTRRGIQVVAASAHNPISGLLALSSAVAALLAGLGAWLASRPIAGLLIGPLSDFRDSVGAIDFTSGGGTDLGSAVGILEVDALRETIVALLQRIGEAVRHAERFAADAAHELRTPLTTIRGELELLAEHASMSPTAVADLTRARSKVLGLQTLVERLLVLALPHHSEWAASELVSLQDLAEDIIAGLPLPERQRVQLEPVRGDVVVRGDAALLGTLLSNALSNALKFGSTSRVAVREDGRDVVLVIDDEGPGVPPEERDRVFEPFVRASAGAGANVAGHGLGLALIAHVARRHGGSARFVGDLPGAHLEVRLPSVPALSPRQSDP